MRISDTCRSVAMRGQLGIVKEVGRQVDVAMGGDDATVRKLNPNDLVFVGMVRSMNNLRLHIQRGRTGLA